MAHVVNQKSLGHRAWRVATRPAAWSQRRVPWAALHLAGLWLRRDSWPYSAIREGDVVVQVCASRGLLRLGRSRAAYFAKLVGPTGRLYVFEPDPKSAATMAEHLRRTGLADRVSVIAKGCWSEKRTLRFWSKRASTLLEDVSEWTEPELRARGYRPSDVSVTTVDAVLAREDNVRLVSVTAKEYEEEILAGATQTLARTDYLTLACTKADSRALSERFGFRNEGLDDCDFTAMRAGA